MKAIILAAGYATRLRPLTERMAKPLLPIAGRPMIETICDKIAELEAVDQVHVVTNHRFAGAFADWAARRAGTTQVAVHDDGTSSNDDRLGAIGDIQFTIDGNEEIGWKPLADCALTSEPYDEAKDIMFFRDRPDSWLSLPAGRLAIFFPDDAHAPLAGRGTLKKAIVKIAVF